MALLPKNICLGRDGRIAIMKKVPKDLWEHPHYKGKAKVVERSTGVTDETSGIEIAKAMLTELERQFAQCRDDLRISLDKSVPGDVDLPKKKTGTAAASKARPRADSAGDQARRDILAAAMIEFSEKGWHGARVDNIAAQTRTTKPMIYYYFGSKEKLYAAVMVEAYGGMRDLEQGLHLNALPPEEAMRRLVEATFDHHAAHPEYVRLIAAENMEYACHISGLPSMVQRNAVAIETIREVLERGERDGVFRPNVNPWHMHLLINSYSFMRVSNRHTWMAIFQVDLWEREDAVAQRHLLVEAALRYLKPDRD